MKKESQNSKLSTKAVIFFAVFAVLLIDNSGILNVKLKDAVFDSVLMTLLITK